MITLGIWPSTTLCYYTFAPMAHVAEFMVSSAFWLAWWRAKDGDRRGRWMLVGLALGLLFLCRWQALLLGLGPESSTKSLA